MLQNIILLIFKI